MNEMTIAEMIRNECIENLLMISAFGDVTCRRQAIEELHQRRLINETDGLADDFMTTLSVIF